MNRKKAILCLGILILAFSISMYTISTNKAEAKNYSTTLSYNEYYTVTSRFNLTENRIIEWSFTGSNNLTGIEVWILDEGNLTFYEDFGIALGYQESDGTHYIDSGTFNVPYNAKWNDLFIHNQIAGNPTSLSIIVNFTSDGSQLTGLWYGLGIFGLFLMVALIFLINHLQQAKKKSGLDQTAHGTPSSFDKESKTRMMTKLDKRESQIRRERILEGGTLPTLSELVVYSPANNEKIDTPEVDVRGKTAIKSIVWINNQASFVDVDGSFIGTVKLFRGKNPVDIVVIGPYGSTLTSSLQVVCTARNAPPLQSTSPKYLLPDHAFDIRHDVTSGAAQPTTDRQPTAVSEDKMIRRKRGKDESVFPKPVTPKPQDSIIVPESEIDPSVLAALKGEPLSEEAISVQSVVSPEEIEIESIDEISDSEIPPIPEIPKDIIEEELETTTVIEEDEEKIEESVDLLEEIIESEDKFEPDEMVPKQPGDKVKEDDLEEIKLDEFKPLHQQEEGTHELEIETKTQQLDDKRSTTIFQHTAILKGEEGEVTQVLKIEKRIECIDGKWFSTLGLANTSDIEIKKLEIIEFVSNTMELPDEYRTNVEEPIIDTLPEGVQVTWVANKVKPQMKIFLTYTELVNPLEIISKKQTKPRIIIRK